MEADGPFYAARVVVLPDVWLKEGVCEGKVPKQEAAINKVENSVSVSRPVSLSSCWDARERIHYSCGAN